jgi:hypothetical protein
VLVTLPARRPDDNQKPKGLNREYQIAAGNSRCPFQLRLIYEIIRHTFISTSRSAAAPELTSEVIRQHFFEVCSQFF